MPIKEAYTDSIEMSSARVYYLVMLLLSYAMPGLITRLKKPNCFISHLSVVPKQGGANPIN